MTFPSPDNPMKARKQKLEAWANAQRIANSWMEFLVSLPPNTVMTDRQWHEARLRFMAAKANPAHIPTL